MYTISDKYLHIQEGESKVLETILQKGKLSGTSEEIELYEKKLADYFGRKYAVATSSGTSAIHCALVGLGIEQDDEVIVPPTAPIMTALPILEQKANVIFADTEKNSFNFDYSDLVGCITEKTKAIVSVPMWGYPYDYDKLIKFCNDYNVPLIEDNAQAHGAIFKEKKVGFAGKISCYSTHDRKILATGEGGFILTDDETIWQKIKSFIQFGNMRGEEFGLNYKLSTLQAALGHNRIDFIDGQIEKRRANASKIKENLKLLEKHGIAEISYSKNGNPNYYSFVLKIDSIKTATKLKDYLKEKGIPSDITRYKYKTLYSYPIFKSWERDCPNSEYLSKTITTIPVHPDVTNEQIDYINLSINEFFLN